VEEAEDQGQKEARTEREETYHLYSLTGSSLKVIVRMKRNRAFKDDKGILSEKAGCEVKERKEKMTWLQRVYKFTLGDLSVTRGGHAERKKDTEGEGTEKKGGKALLTSWRALEDRKKRISFRNDSSVTNLKRDIFETPRRHWKNRPKRPEEKNPQQSN